MFDEVQQVSVSDEEYAPMCVVEEWNGHEWKRCDRPYMYREVCNRHYQRLRRAGVLPDYPDNKFPFPPGMRFVTDKPERHVPDKGDELDWCHQFDDDIECTRPAHGGTGLCKQHYERQEREIAEWDSPPANMPQPKRQRHHSPGVTLERAVYPDDGNYSELD